MSVLDSCPLTPNQSKDTFHSHNLSSDSHVLKLSQPILWYPKAPVLSPSIR